ncbi:A24 family peptidase [Streptomyces sp. NPDC007162]|uniref:prepilin peptidase n=1 Tax=Streptomyces sp. NPDC007162 TaxID=3156917 RepID=UPI0033E1329B
MTTASDLALPAAAALWGAAAGALLPRAAYRFSAPAGEPWHDTCPAGHRIEGWLGRARCTPCTPATDRRNGTEQGYDVALAEAVREEPYRRTTDLAARYGPRAVLLALATALACVALALATGTRPELAVWLLLAPVGVLLAVVDFRVQRLPDPLTLPLAAAALALLGVAALLPEHAGDWLTSLYAALALGAGYLVLFLVNPGGMGFGDVKLALGTGAVLGWYGWPTVLLGTFAGFLCGALYGGALVVVRRAGRKTAIAFGPFLIAGAFAGLLIGARTA